MKATARSRKLLNIALVEDDADLAESIEANTVHGSDGPDTAAQEIAYFFRGIEICPRG